MSKLRASTFFCAPSITRLSIPLLDRFAFFHADSVPPLLATLIRGENPQKIVLE